MSSPAGGRRPRKRGLTRGVRIGAIAGDPIILTPGWLILTLVLTVAFVPTVQRSTGQVGAGSIGIALAVPILLAISVLIHEIAHGLTARAFKYRVIEYVITLWGGHTRFTTELDRPGPMAAVAVAGPLANVALAVGGWFLAGSIGVGTDGAVVGTFLARTLALTNGFVAVFNLLPAAPMDGGKLLEALVWRVTGDHWRGMAIAGRIGQVSAVVVAVAYPAWSLLRLGQQPDLLTTAFSLIIAGVLWRGAKETVEVAHMRQISEGLRIADFTSPATVITADTPVSAIRTLPAIIIEPAGTGAGMGGGKPHATGVIDKDALDAVPEALRATTPAAAVQRSMKIGIVTAPGGSEAVSQLAAAVNSGSGAVVYLPASGTVPAGIVPPGVSAAGIIDVPALLKALK